MTILNNDGMTIWKIKKRKDKAVLGIPISEKEFLQEMEQYDQELPRKEPPFGDLQLMALEKLQDWGFVETNKYIYSITLLFKYE